MRPAQASGGRWGAVLRPYLHLAPERGTEATPSRDHAITPTGHSAPATDVMRARPNLRAVQELLGHAWVTTTQRYTHVEVEDLQAQVAELPANGFCGPS